jgi:hypothetical protein
MIVSRKSDTLAAGLSPMKIEAIKGLSQLGLKLSDGYDYVLWEYVSSETTLDDVKKRLSSIKTSLSEDIIEERKK